MLEIYFNDMCLVASGAKKCMDSAWGPPLPVRSGLSLRGTYRPGPGEKFVKSLLNITIQLRSPSRNVRESQPTERRQTA